MMVLGQWQGAELVLHHKYFLKNLVPYLLIVMSGHSVNLAVNDTIKQCKLILETHWNIKIEISKLIKYSPEERCNISEA